MLLEAEMKKGKKKLKKYKIISHLSESHERIVFANTLKEAGQIVLGSCNSQYVGQLQGKSHRDILEIKNEKCKNIIKK